MKRHETQSGARLQLLIDVLSRHGPIEDRSGRATAILHELMIAEGYTQKFPAAVNLVRSAATAGLVTREVRGKRTYRIALSDQAQTPWPGATSAAPSEPEPDPGVDLSALAVAVLDRALAARQDATNAEVVALEALERAERAEKALQGRQEDPEAPSLREQLAEAERRLQGLSGQLTQAEEAVVTFRGRCEELDDQNRRLKRALRRSEDNQRNGSTYPVRDLLSDVSRAELAKLMSEPPTTKGA